MNSHGFNDWSEAQKVRYLIKGINTNLVDTYLANISGSAALCYDFASEARHVADFIVIIKSLEPGRNRNILGVDTDRGGGGGRGCGGGPV